MSNQTFPPADENTVSNKGQSTSINPPVFDAAIPPSFSTPGREPVCTEKKCQVPEQFFSMITGYGKFAVRTLVFLAVLAVAGYIGWWALGKPALANVIPNKPVNEAVAKLERAFRNNSPTLIDWSKDDVDVFLDAAEKGNRKAQFLLAYCYQEGKGVNTDSERAEEWLRKSAEQGDAWGQYFLGAHLLDKYPRKTTDTEEALDWFRKSAENGNGKSAQVLAEIYFYGKGVKRNLDEAEKWIAKSESQNFIDTNNLKSAIVAERELEEVKRKIRYDELKAELSNREQNAVAKEKKLDDRAVALADAAKTLTEREQRAVLRERELDGKATALADTARTLTGREQQAIAKEKQNADDTVRNDKKKQELDERERNVVALTTGGVEEIKTLQKKYEERESVLEKEYNARNAALTEREQNADAKEKSNADTVKSFEEREQKIIKREGELNDLRKELSGVEERLSAQKDKVMSSLKAPFRRVKVTIAGETFEAVQLDTDPAQDSPLVPLGLKKGDVITHIGNIRTDLEIHGKMPIRFVKEGKQQGEGTIDVP